MIETRPHANPVAARFAAPPPSRVSQSLSKFRKSALALTALVGGATASAAPLAFNDDFTLSTTNQNMWGSGASTAWSYDVFRGIQWGTYLDRPNLPKHGPETIGINAITGSSDTVIIPSVCFWTPWGEQCTGALTADTRTGASVGLTTSGQLGLNVKASAGGGGISAVLPVKTTLQVTDLAAAGGFHVGGTAVIDTVKGGAQISATAPSFKAGVNTVANMDASIYAKGCLVLVGCKDDSAPGGFTIDQNILTVNSANAKPLNVLGLEFGVPGVDSFFKYRKGGIPCEGQGFSDCPIEVGGILLAQGKLSTLKNFSGGTYDPNSNVLNLSKNSPVFTVDADLTGLAQALAGLTVDVLNPSINLNIPGIGSSISVGVKLADLQAGIQLGLQQSFGVTPSLQATLLFDKPVSEFVQVLDHVERRPAGYKEVISFTENANNVLLAQFQQNGKFPTDEELAALKAGGCAIRTRLPDHDDGDKSKVEGSSCNVYKEEIRGTCIGGSGCRVNPDSLTVLLRPGEAFRLDLPHYVRQCRIVDQNPYPWDISQEVPGTLHDVDCYSPAVLKEAGPVFQDVPIYRKELVERGTTVTIDLDKGADLQFTGEKGQLLWRSFTMDDSDNFRSVAGISFAGHERFQAGCLNASAVSFSFNECLFDQEYVLPFGDATVFDDSFALAGFNTVSFSTFDERIDPLEPPLPPGPPNPTPEPSTLWLMLLALAVGGHLARRRSLRQSPG